MNIRTLMGSIRLDKYVNWICFIQLTSVFLSWSMNFIICILSSGSFILTQTIGNLRGRRTALSRGLDCPNKRGTASPQPMNNRSPSSNNSRNWYSLLSPWKLLLTYPNCLFGVRGKIAPARGASPISVFTLPGYLLHCRQDEAHLVASALSHPYSSFSFPPPPILLTLFVLLIIIPLNLIFIPVVLSSSHSLSHSRLPVLLYPGANASWLNTPKLVSHLTLQASSAKLLKWISILVYSLVLIFQDE